MTTDWNNLLDASGMDKDDIKTRLPLEYVVIQSGVGLERRGDRLVGLCPFHGDKEPSFAIWAQDTAAGTTVDRCGCWTCHFGTGDVFDYIKAWRGVGFQDALKIAFELLQQFEAEEDWEPSPLEVALNINEIDYLTVTKDAFDAASYDLNAINNFINQKRLKISSEWLHQEFRVGVLDHTTIVIPHFHHGEVTGYKKREGARTPYGAPGSKFTELYGAWRDTQNHHVMITEGESDTWVAAWEFRGQYDVFGLPSGANQPPRDEWVERLQGRDVTLVFDGDRTGREAARTWWTALHPFASTVRVAAMDDGRDVCTTHNLREVITEALVRNDLTGQIIPDPNSSGNFYVLQTQQATRNVSDWRFYPTRYLVSKDRREVAFEGRLSNGADAVLTPSDLNSESTIKKWCSQYGMSWRGSSKDTQDLLNYLMHEAPFLPRGRLTHEAGWHEGHIVLPDMCLGPRHWKYVSPPADVGLRDKVTIKAAPWQQEGLVAMMGLHRTDVMTPIIAWMSAAPLRGMVKRFPLLALVGGAGLGKTTLVEEVLGCYGWHLNTTLTATTPHAIQSLVASSSGVPVWVDEYRRGARKDTKEAFEQIMRDAWDGSASMKGGMYESNKQILMERAATAPIVITGEDVFSETSHLERMALLQIPHNGRNQHALGVVRGADMTGFGYSYLSWLVDSYWNDTLIAIAEPPLADRPAWVRAVLEWGWDLFKTYLGEVCSFHLDVDLDLSLVDASFSEARTANPIIDAIIWGHDERDRDLRPFCWEQDGTTFVRVRPMLAEYRKMDGPTMPGGERAVTNWLTERFNGTIERTRWGKAVRFDTPQELSDALHIEGEGEENAVNDNNIADNTPVY